MTTHCTNTKCTQRAQCNKGADYRDGDVVKHYTRRQFEPCKHFKCVAHNFVYVIGSADRECQECGHGESHYRFVSCEWAGYGDMRNA